MNGSTITWFVILRDIFASIEDAKILSYFQHMRNRKINLTQSSGTYLYSLQNLLNVTLPSLM
jgi:hypothetical protein